MSTLGQGTEMLQRSNDPGMDGQYAVAAPAISPATWRRPEVAAALAGAFLAVQRQALRPACRNAAQTLGRSINSPMLDTGEFDADAIVVEFDRRLGAAGQHSI